MKTPSGTFALKLLILAASAIASIALISACKRSITESIILPTVGRPILLIMDGNGVKSEKPPDVIKNTCKQLNDVAGKTVCEVKVYDNNGHEVQDNRSLTITNAVRSEAAANSAAADPINVTQKAVFANFDEAAEFLKNIK